jgi:hypothetical protein
VQRRPRPSPSSSHRTASSDRTRERRRTISVSVIGHDVWAYQMARINLQNAVIAHGRANKNYAEVTSINRGANPGMAVQMKSASTCHLYTKALSRQGYGQREAECSAAILRSATQKANTRVIYLCKIRPRQRFTGKPNKNDDATGMLHPYR